jgi:predicted nucleic acid-binding protein
MNVLVDTNVVISAVIRDRLHHRVINEIVSRDDWFWIVTTEIETEYREVLASEVQSPRCNPTKLASFSRRNHGSSFTHHAPAFSA